MDSIHPNRQSKLVSPVSHDYFYSTTCVLKLQEAIWVCVCVRMCICVSVFVRVSHHTLITHPLQWKVVSFHVQFQTLCSSCWTDVGSDTFHPSNQRPRQRDLSSVSKPCRSGFFLTCVSLTCSSKSILAAMICRTLSWSPNFWSISVRVIHRLHPKVRLRLFWVSWNQKSDCFHWPWHWVHCSKSICSFCVSL